MLLAVFDFPAFNAGLNSLSGVLIAVGYLAIRRKQVKPTSPACSAPLVVSALFLTSYLYYHIVVQRASRPTLPSNGLLLLSGSVLCI